MRYSLEIRNCSNPCASMPGASFGRTLLDFLAGTLVLDHLPQYAQNLDGRASVSI